MPNRDIARILQDIDNAMDRQVREWPDRASGFEDISLLTDELAAAFLDEPMGDQFKACKPEIAATLRCNALFLGGSPKGGTTMLVQLFDNHPECVTMPHDSRMVHLMAEPPEASAVGTLLGVWLRKMISPNALPPFWNLGREVESYRRFANAYRRLDAQFWGEPGGVLVAAMLAIAQASGRTDTTHMVEKTCANVLHPERAFDAFPGAKMIQIARDPYATLAALAKQTSVRNWDWPFQSRLDDVRSYLTAASTNPGRFGEERYRVVSYEQLVAEPEPTMRALAEFAGIVFHHALTTPTVMGHPAESNSMFSERRAIGRLVTEDRDAAHRRWAEAFSPPEQETIIATIGDLAEGLGYPAPVGMKVV